MNDVSVSVGRAQDERNRYLGVCISASGKSATVSERFARDLATTIKDDRPELAARIIDICDEVGRSTSFQHEDIADDLCDWGENPREEARAYGVLGLRPPSNK